MKKQKFRNDKIRIAFFAIVIISILLVGLNLPRVMVPFGIAYVIALMIRPIQRMLFSVELRKKLFAVLGIIFFGFSLSYPVINIVKTIKEESHKIPTYVPKLDSYFKSKYEILRQEVKFHFNYELQNQKLKDFFEIDQQKTQNIINSLQNFLSSALEWGLLIPLFLFFIIKDERTLRFRFIKIVPNNMVERTYYLYHQFNTKFGDYIFAKAIEAMIVGLIITIGLLIIDYPFAFLLGIIAGVTNILPYIGPIAGFVPALVVGLVDQNPNTTLGAMTILYIIANVIDLAFVFPVLVSKIVNLHPLIVVVSVILGSQFGGIVGMIISIPLAAFFKLLFQEVYSELYGKV